MNPNSPFDDMSRKEKDEWAERRMNEMKLKNEQYRQRHALVERDRLDAEQQDAAITVGVKTIPLKREPQQEKPIRYTEKRVEREWDKGKAPDGDWGSGQHEYKHARPPRRGGLSDGRRDRRDQGYSHRSLGYSERNRGNSNWSRGVLSRNWGGSDRNYEDNFDRNRGDYSADRKNGEPERDHRDIDRNHGYSDRRPRANNRRSTTYRGIMRQQDSNQRLSSISHNANDYSQGSSGQSTHKCNESFNKSSQNWNSEFKKQLTSINPPNFPFANFENPSVKIISKVDNDQVWHDGELNEAQTKQSRVENWVKSIESENWGDRIEKHMSDDVSTEKYDTRERKSNFSNKASKSKNYSQPAHKSYSNYDEKQNHEKIRNSSTSDSSLREDSRPSFNDKNRQRFRKSCFQSQIRQDGHPSTIRESEQRNNSKEKFNKSKYNNKLPQYRNSQSSISSKKQDTVDDKDSSWNNYSNKNKKYQSTGTWSDDGDAATSKTAWDNTGGTWSDQEDDHQTGPSKNSVSHWEEDAEAQVSGSMWNKSDSVDQRNKGHSSNNSASGNNQMTVVRDSLQSDNNLANQSYQQKSSGNQSDEGSVKSIGMELQSENYQAKQSHQQASSITRINQDSVESFEQTRSNKKNLECDFLNHNKDGSEAKENDLITYPGAMKSESKEGDEKARLEKDIQAIEADLQYIKVEEDKIEDGQVEGNDYQETSSMPVEHNPDERLLDKNYALSMLENSMVNVQYNVEGSDESPVSNLSKNINCSELVLNESSDMDCNISFDCDKNDSPLTQLNLKEYNMQRNLSSNTTNDEAKTVNAIPMLEESFEEENCKAEHSKYLKQSVLNECEKNRNMSICSGKCHSDVDQYDKKEDDPLKFTSSDTLLISITNDESRKIQVVSSNENDRNYSETFNYILSSPDLLEKSAVHNEPINDHHTCEVDNIVVNAQIDESGNSSFQIKENASFSNFADNGEHQPKEIGTVSKDICKGTIPQMKSNLLKCTLSSNEIEINPGALSDDGDNDWLTVSESDSEDLHKANNIKVKK